MHYTFTVTTETGHIDRVSAPTREMAVQRTYMLWSPGSVRPNESGDIMRALVALEPGYSTHLADYGLTFSLTNNDTSEPCPGCGAEAGEDCHWDCMSQVTDPDGQPLEITDQTTSIMASDIVAGTVITDTWGGTATITSVTNLIMLHVRDDQTGGIWSVTVSPTDEVTADSLT